VKVHGHEIDPRELSKMMFEISAGWEWGDPRSELTQTAENKAFWNQLKIQMREDAERLGFGTGDAAADGDHVERTYLAKKKGREIAILYMMEQAPDSLRDLVLRESGWVRTSTLADWRFGERSDIDIITREAAKKTAEDWGVGQFIR
jgi:hypothetical protein|tara:strand:- start:425 stop:865 length:441 start_codon:yes stop_codon:yes gene_type:complete